MAEMFFRIIVKCTILFAVSIIAYSCNIGCTNKPENKAVSTESANGNLSIEKLYPFDTIGVDSISIKLCRFEHDEDHDSLMARYVFDYFYELQWEESGIAEEAHYRYEEKDSILKMINNAALVGKIPEVFLGEEYYQNLYWETPADDQNIVVKIEIYNRESKLKNVLWCSHKYIDGMEEFKYPLRRKMPKELSDELNRIHSKYVPRCK